MAAPLPIAPIEVSPRIIFQATEILGSNGLDPSALQLQELSPSRNAEDLAARPVQLETLLRSEYLLGTCLEMKANLNES